ncbi:F-box only protein 8-like [Rutidosis leptorrhynchoides]|uniref:F-box only protein 8-like n=1 Tax=Rutidosis leptorrhynchoides TaxID=125765 RepID=UPI003A993218
MAKKRKTMSNYIPSEIKIKIFCHLPVKSLIRFRSVSKEWKSLIDSSEFNSDYIIRQAQRKRILLQRVLYKGFVDDHRERGEYCWIVDDDDSFPQHVISLTYPLSVNRLLNTDNNKRLVGYSHGLLCFTGCYSGEIDSFNRYVIWNPSIRKSVSIDAPYYKSFFAGFGVCPNSLDPKIVRINVHYDNDHKQNVWRVGVFALSGGVWRSPLTKLPSKWFDISLFDHQTPVVLNGFIYWCAYTSRGQAIISFNLESEEFTKILGPNNSKIFTLKLPHKAKVVGFKDNDQLIIEDRGILIEKEDGDVRCHDVNGTWRMCEYRPELVVYDPYLKHSNNLGLHVSCLSFTSSYIESLLLLDRSDTLNDDEYHDAALTSTSKEYMN